MLRRTCSCSSVGAHGFSPAENGPQIHGLYPGILSAVGNPAFQHPPKINLKKLQNFRRLKNVFLQTIFATQFTAFCPQINHPQTPKNSKTPSKNHLFPSQFFPPTKNRKLVETCTQT